MYLFHMIELMAMQWHQINHKMLIRYLYRIYTTCAAMGQSPSTSSRGQRDGTGGGRTCGRCVRLRWARTDMSGRYEWVCLVCIYIHSYMSSCLRIDTRFWSAKKVSMSVHIEASTRSSVWPTYRARINKFQSPSHPAWYRRSRRPSSRHVACVVGMSFDAIE